MNSQPKIVVTSASPAHGKPRSAPWGLTGITHRAGKAAALLVTAALLSALTACGQKGGLYLPDNPPASSRHGGTAGKSAKQPATATTASSAASAATTNSSSAQP